MAIYSVHEAFTHKVLFQRRGPISRLPHRIGPARRLAGVEPNFYAVHHVSHHQKFGTEEDGELRVRAAPPVLVELLPFAAFYADFASPAADLHQSRFLTTLRTISFHIVACMYRSPGWRPGRGVRSCFFTRRVLSRSRTSVHRTQPDAARRPERFTQFWPGFGACSAAGRGHRAMEHHLVPEVPWYHQLMLHHHLRLLPTPQTAEAIPRASRHRLADAVVAAAVEPTRIEEHGKSNRSPAPRYRDSP
jgi:hypothetical protein